jgi:hypothetical protein
MRKVNSCMSHTGRQLSRLVRHRRQEAVRLYVQRIFLRKLIIVNLGEAIKIRVAAHCFEGKCFGVISASPMTATREYLIKRDPSIAALFDGMPGGTTMFLNPLGTQVGDEIVGDDEGIAYANIDLNECIEPKQFHDFVGGYQRYDIFKVTVDRSRQQPVHWKQETTMTSQTDHVSIDAKAERAE